MSTRDDEAKAAPHADGESERTPNNNTIDGPSYYRLADGTYLEDALFDVDPAMPGPIWDACVYRFRAGHKDGEPLEKDMAKVDHYVAFYARRSGYATWHVERRIEQILDSVYARHGNPWIRASHGKPWMGEM